MKKINKILSLILLICIGFTSCEDSDKNPLNLHEDASNVSPFVRIILDTKTVGVSDLSTKTVNANVSAPANNVESWQANVRVTGSMQTNWAPLVTVTSFPSDFSFTINEVAAALGINVSDILPADIIEFQGIATGIDGTVLTIDQLDGNSANQPELRQAFSFDITVLCAPLDSPAGDWVINMADSFGDGWDGAFITLSIDGVETRHTFSAGFTNVVNLNIPTDAQNVFFTYTPGSFEEEHSFTITDPSGTTFGTFSAPIAFCFL